MKLGQVGMMLHVEPSFVLYALLPDPGCCPRGLENLMGSLSQGVGVPAFSVCLLFPHPTQAGVSLGCLCCSYLGKPSLCGAICQIGS